STCDRKQVGAVIAHTGRVMSIGYNGAPPGLPHCDKNHHGWQAHWDQWADLSESNAQVAVHQALQENGCRNATHAEANALAFAARYGVSTDLADLFVTVSPCLDCSKLLIAAGICTVYYREAYRDLAGIDLLQEANVWCAQV